MVTIFPRAAEAALTTQDFARTAVAAAVLRPGALRGFGLRDRPYPASFRVVDHALGSRAPHPGVRHIAEKLGASNFPATGIPRARVSDGAR
jgi:hypothetical protein